jgi:transcriptional regulator with XRE-family HTH domain
MSRPARKPTNGIKYHRLRLCLTQAELAVRVGTLTKNIVYWERWLKEPTPEQKAKLAGVLGCEVDELLTAIAPELEREVDRHKMSKLAVKRPARYRWTTEEA